MKLAIALLALLMASGAHAETGIASYYGHHERYARYTACGEVFRPLSLTAAHRTLPCGTLVRVTDTATGNYVDVTVTDRGPFIRGRIIDLSYGAAIRLGIVARGTAHVRVQRLWERP